MTITRNAKPATLIDSRDLIFRTEDGAPPKHVFDGHCLLEPECYDVDRVGGEFRLKRPPAFDVRTASHDRGEFVMSAGVERDHEDWLTKFNEEGIVPASGR